MRTPLPSNEQQKPGSPIEAPIVFEAKGLSKSFSVSSGPLSWRKSKVVQAVKSVDFALHDRETLSIVGESGCGKTTTARMLLDLETPSSGAVLFHGVPLTQLRSRSDYAKYRLGVQAVFQDATSALSPRRRIRDIISEPLTISGLRRGAELDAQVLALLERVGLNPGVKDSLPHELSGGMRQRVAIAQALATNPSVIILDEPVSALDVSIRAQILNLLKDMQQRYGISYVLISHDLATVRYLSHSVLAMYLGSVMEQAPAALFYSEATHPYTVTLLSAAMPASLCEPQECIVLSGDLPSPANPPPGCSFHTRCWLKRALGDPPACTTQAPQPQAVQKSHVVRCHFVEEAQKSPIRQRILNQLRHAAPAAADEDGAP